MVTIMSDMFESLELNMRQEAERINPTKAIMASQLECEQRFESFVAKNPERVDFLSDDIRSVADKYAAEYDIPSETIYEATVNHLKDAAVKKANPYVDPFAGKDEAHSDLINDYVGYNMDLDQIELYWNQYKPLVQSALQGGWNQDQNQLEMELEHLKNELEGIDSEEEGSDKYWSLEEQISKALSALYDSGVDHSLDEAAGTDLKEAAIRQAEWDKPWTEEDESKEEDEEDEESDSEEKEEEDEEEEKKESSAREAKECNCWDGYKRVPGTKPCSPGSCEKCDADREKKKAAFILENADSLVPEWIQKNAGWREMLRGFMDRNNDVGYNAPDWSSEDKPLPARARKMDELESQEQPTIELNRPSSEKSEYEDMIEDQSRAEEKMKENARRRKEMIEGEPQFKTRGPNRYDYLRGASVKALEEFYVAQGIPEKTASILVEAVGEMAQLQQNEPGLPAGASDPSRMSIDKEIGGSEGEKYKNLDVKQKQKELGLEHQDFTDFGEPVREFIQPGGKAPYSENTKDKEKAQATSDMNAKGVKQEDNAPKQSNNAWEDSNEETNWNKAYKDMYLKLLQEGLSEEEADQEAMNHANSTRAEKVDRKKSSSLKESGIMDMVKGMVSNGPVGTALKAGMGAAQNFVNRAPTPLKMLTPAPALLGMAGNAIMNSPSSKPALSQPASPGVGGFNQYNPSTSPKAPTPSNPGSFNPGSMLQFKGSNAIAEMIRGMDDESLSREYEELGEAYKILTSEDLNTSLETAIQDQIEEWLQLMWENISDRIKESENLEEFDSKKSNASVKEASELSLVPPEGVRNAARRGIKYHSEGKAGDGFESATLARAKKIAEGQELTPEHVKRMHSFFERHAGGRSQKAKQGETTPWDVAWLAWGGNAGRTWAAAKVKQMENAKTSANRSDEIEEIEKEIAKLKRRDALDGGYIYPGDDDIASDELADLHKRLKELKQENSKEGAAPLDFDLIDNEVEKLMSDGMTPEQAIQSIGVYDDNFIGWGSGSKR